MKTYLKKSVLAWGLLALLSAPLTSRAQDTDYYYADVNCDGVVNIADLVIVIDCILEGEGTTIKPDPDKAFVSAREYGAVGDGVTDDTYALENLFAAAYQLKKAVYFEPGTYLISRSLSLRTGMEIYGSEATLTKKPAVTTSLKADAVKNQNSIEVADASGFNVGDQFFIADSEGAEWSTCGIVESIVGNTIRFSNVISDQQPDFPGCVRAYPSGSQVSTSFALLRSWTARFECDGVSVRDLTLDGNRADSEPLSWVNSCICMDAYRPGGFTGQSGIEFRNVQRNLIARNLVIRNSPHDGISDHSEGGLVARGCVIENSAMHGVHLGEKYKRAMIYNNQMTGNGSVGSGVCFGQEVTDVIVDNNTISMFEHACSEDESGGSANYLVICNNQVKSITDVVFDFTMATSEVRGGNLQISKNTITRLCSTLLSGDYLDDVMLFNNEVKSIASVPANLMKFGHCRNVIISANKIPSSAAISTPVLSTDTDNLITSSNTWN